MRGYVKLITEKAPGKLYIAGEYAVVENGYPAILVALDQFVTCSIEESAAEVGKIISRQYHNNALQWYRLGEQMVVDNRDNPFSYILSAIKVTEEYARSFARELRIFDLHIDSQLDSDSGKKYGLGSSAAVTVATVKALKAPSNLQLLIGWTGKPASTSQLVDKISLFKARQQKEYRQFLEDSKHCIQRMVEGFHNADLESIKNEIRYNRELLKQLGTNSGVHIETPVLNKLCQIAEDFGGAAKTSGAGGGDCGIVAIDRDSNFKQVLKKWTANKIEQLPLSVHFIENVKGEIKHHLIKK